MTVFDIADYSTPFIEASGLFLLFATFMKSRVKLSVWMVGVGIFSLGSLITICNYYFLYQYPNNFFMILLGAIFGFIFYAGSPIIAFLISAAGNAISLLLEVVILNSITFVFRVTVEEAVAIDEYRLLGISMSKIALLVVCYAIYQYKKRKKYEVTKNYWLLFLSLFCVILVTVFVLFKLSHEVINIDYNGITLLCTIGLFAVMFFSLYLYDRQAQQAHTIHLQEQAELHMQEQLKHMDELVAQQDQLRRFRHDISNQLIVLQQYLIRDVSENDLHHVNTIMNSFELTDSIIDTGNLPLDAIISAKQILAQKKGIDFEYQLQIPENLPMAPEDICGIFGNALDNAIEACERINQGEKLIRCVLMENNEGLFCKIVNTAPTPKDKVWTTSKKDKKNHGYGLSQIKIALEKYGSEPQFIWENNQFIFKFMVFFNTTNDEK